MNWRRLLWIYLQIVITSAISVFVFSQHFTDVQFSVAAGAVGTVAFVSMILGGMVAGSVYLYYVFRTVWRRVLALAWPVMVEQITRTLMRTTDVFIMALFSSAAVVAIGLSELYSQFPLRIGQGLGSAAIALSSQDTGRESTANRDEAITRALVLGFVLGVPIAVAGVLFSDRLIALLGAAPDVVDIGGTYLAIIIATAPARQVANIGANSLQGTGDTMTPMYVNVFANVLNIGGSLVLGLGLFGAPELRVVGVGIATATANVVSAVLLVSAIAGPWTSTGLTRPRNPVIARQIVVIGVPRTAEGFAEALARFPFNTLLLLFGTEVNAGYQIGKRIYQQITSPLSRAYQTTASITVGQALGAEDAETARFEGWAVVTLGVLSVGVIGVDMFVAAEPIARLFTDDPETVAQSVAFARSYGLAATPMVIFVALSGSLQGASETRVPFLARTTGTFGFFLGFSYLAGVPFGYGPLGAYVGIALSYVWMALVVMWVYIHRDWAGRAIEMMSARASIESS